MDLSSARGFLPGYHALGALHSDSTPSVIRALRKSDGRPVICKIVTAAAERPEAAQALEREFAILMGLSHPGIVQPLDLITDGHDLILLLNDIGGTSLDQLCADHPLDTKTLLELALDLVDALATLHHHGIAHLSLSPANIVWSSDNRQINLIDFSRAATTAEGSAKVAPLTCDTRYISPEQTGRMSCDIDYRSDFYSLGATLHFMATGKPPFDDTDSLQLFHSHIARTPVPAHKLNHGIPAMISSIIARLMAKDPNHRFQSCFGLKTDLAQCLDRWRKLADVPPFPVASRDRKPVIEIPDRIYGRDAYRSRLVAALDRVAEGDHDIVFLAGPSGIGKTSLVQELRRPVAARLGLFLTGKFEPLRHDIPYAPLIQCFGDLFRRWPDEEAAAGRGQDLKRALGSDAGLLTDVIPPLTRLLDPQVAVPSMEPAAAENRFVFLFRRMIAALARPTHPLVLFLDDLQWADQSSLRLMEALATDPELRFFLLIGTFRDNEVDRQHPLQAVLTSLQRKRRSLDTLHLGSLDTADVALLLADAFQVPIDDVQSLATLLGAETQGNPFFLRQYIETLCRQRLIVFDHLEGGWTWNLEAIADRQVGDNLADITLSRIHALPEDCLSVLKTAACIGSVFDLGVLSGAAGITVAEAARLIHPALQNGLIFPTERSAGDRGEAAPHTQYRFSHDQIEQAVYSRMDADDASQRHLAIGYTLERMISADAPPFERVYQLNRALPLLSDNERTELAALNLRAARAARSTVAIGPARSYMDAGLEALPGDAWAGHYVLALDLHVEGAELAVWAGDDDALARHITAITAHARGELDQVKAYDILIQHHIARQQPGLALAKGREALDLLGVPLPRAITSRHVAAELLHTRLVALGKTEVDLARLPSATDPKRCAIGRILFLCAAPAYFADQDLFAVVTCRSVRLCLTQGEDPWTATSYAYYGVILASRLARYDQAGLFGRAALNHFQETQDCPQAIFMVKAFIEPWHQSTARTWPGLIDAHRLLMARGDFFYAHLALAQVVIQKLFMGTPLDALATDAATFAKSADNVGQPAPAMFLRIFQQAIANLQGRTADRGAFRGPFVDEEGNVGGFQASGNIRVLWQLHAFRAYLNLLFGDLAEARRQVAALRALSVSSLGQVADLRHAAIATVIDFATWSDVDRSERSAVLRRARAVEARLHKAVRHGVAPLSALAHLLVGERCRVTDRPGSAAKAYDRALEAARLFLLPHDEGLIAERAAAHALAQGFTVKSEALLHQAVRAWERWQAKAKAADTRQRIEGKGPDPGLASLSSLPSHAPPNPGGGTAIDILTAIRAFHALAENIRLVDLLERLMRLVLANAGATRACLLLESDGIWKIEATAAVDDDSCRVLQGVPFERYLGPEACALVDQVRRQLEPMVVADAARITPDAAVRPPENGPRSMMCIPLKSRNRLAGMIYLENHLAPGIFSQERVTLLDLISTQIAISIENARLYEDLASLNDSLERQVALRSREAQEKSRLLEATLANMGDGLLAFDGSGTLVVYNSQAFQSLGLAEDFPPSGMRADTLCQMVGPIADDRERPLEISFADGRVIKLRRRPMAGGGEVYVFFDLTDERRRQNELRDARAQAEFARFDAERANDAKTLFLASVGHDLRQPVQALQLLTSVLSIRLEGDGTAADVLVRMESALATLQKILDSLLDISRLEAGIVPVDAVDIDLAAVLTDWTEMIRPQAVGKPLELLVLPTDLHARADQALLYRVVTNLLDNAIKYTPAGQIVMSCAARPPLVRIEVRDSGPGVPLDRQQAIFEDFVQLNNVERNHTKGLGLGLAIARRLARLMGGEVGVVSAPGHGSCFWIELPESVEDTSPPWRSV
jgi:predicted ATPase/signal transduction histidine kinase